MKMKAFIRIFKIMDSDNDGIISKYNRDLNKLPISITKILQPFIRQMEVFLEIYPENKFIQEVNKIFEVITKLT